MVERGALYDDQSGRVLLRVAKKLLQLAIPMSRLRVPSLLAALRAPHLAGYVA
jgi:hypothetical protein